jgi:hypothetical protein
VELERGSAGCPLLWRRRDRMQDPYAAVFVEKMLGELCKGIGIVESRRGATGG